MLPRTAEQDAALFPRFCAEVRAKLDELAGDGARALAGGDDDIRGYFDDGYNADYTARELLSYAD